MCFIRTVCVYDLITFDWLTDWRCWLHKQMSLTKVIRFWFECLSKLWLVHQNMIPAYWKPERKAQANKYKVTTTFSKNCVYVPSHTEICSQCLWKTLLVDTCTHILSYHLYPDQTLWQFSPQLFLSPPLTLSLWWRDRPTRRLPRVAL